MKTNPTITLLPQLREFAASHAAAPLSPWEKRDKSLLPVRRFKKQVADEDANKSESGIVKAAATGAIAGGLLRGKKGAAVGAGVGVLAQAAARHISAKTKDFYGERSRRGKQIDSVPTIAGELAVAGIGARKIANGLNKLKAPRRISRAFSANVPHGTLHEFDATTIGARRLEAAVADHIAAGSSKAAGIGSKLKNAAQIAGVGGAALAVGGAAEGFVDRDKDESLAHSVAHGAVKGGVFGAALVGAGEPLVRKVFPNAAKLAHFSVAVRAGLIELKAADPKKPGMSTTRKVVAGGLIAAGVSALPAAASFGKGALNVSRLAKRTGKGPSNLGGKAVANYIIGSQRALNRGAHGKVIGTLLGHARANPGGNVEKILGGPGYVDHLTRFRSSHQDALGHMTHEYVHRKGTPIGNADKVWGQHNAVIDDIKKTKIEHGLNESDALKHVASKFEHQPYFNKLAGYKGPAFKEYTIKTGAVAGAAIGAGATVAATGGGATPDKPKRKVSLSDVRVTIEFAGYGRKQLVTDNGQKADPLRVASGHQEGFYIKSHPVTGKNYIDRDDPVKVSYANGQVVRAALNKGRGVAKWGGRGGRLLRDAVHTATGKERIDERGRPMKKEWNKAWVRGAVATGLAGAAVIGHHALRKPGSGYDKFLTNTENKVKGAVEKRWPNTFPNHVSKPSSQPHLPGMGGKAAPTPPSTPFVPKKVVPGPGFKAPAAAAPKRTGTPNMGSPEMRAKVPDSRTPIADAGHVPKTGHPVLDAAVSKAVGTAKAPLAGPKKPAPKPKAAPAPKTPEGKKPRAKKDKGTQGQMTFAVRDGRLIQLASDYADPNGWDVRDGRGHSARIFAPGSRKRFRREKTPLERVGVQRKILGGLAIAGTAAGAIGGIAYGTHRGFRQGVNHAVSEAAKKVSVAGGKIIPFKKMPA